MKRALNPQPAPHGRAASELHAAAMAQARHA